MSSPLTPRSVADLSFMEHRAALLDLAAFLDRHDRALAAHPGTHEDFRVAALKRILPLLQNNTPDRARLILDALSDPTEEPIPQSPGKGATGVWAPEAQR